MRKQIDLTEEQEKQIIYNYTVLKQGLRTAGKFIPVSDKIVTKVLAKYNIHHRTVQEANINKYFVNHDYFKKQSHDMAYWLGILGSDGCVASNKNQIYIELQRSDKELLEKLNKTIENERPVQDYTTGKGYENSKLYFFSKEIKKDLQKYHIIPNKTYNQEYKFPEKLSQEYYFDYIRGLFDGDGCIKEVHGTPCFQIDTGSLDIAEHIVEIFKKYNIELKIQTLPKKNMDIYRVYAYSQEKNKKIYNLLYKDDPYLYLNRKKQKFLDLLS